MPLIGMTGLASLFALWGPGGLLTDGTVTQNKEVVIEKGTGLIQVSQNLANEGVIDHPWLFMADAVLSGRASKIKAGEYEIPAGAPPESVLKILCEGKVVVHRLTIPEGFTVQQVVELLNKEKHLKGEIKDIPKEGSLLPETYSFVRGDDRAILLKRMKTAMESALKEIWEKREGDCLLKTPEEALILASIVEKETGKAKERPEIAGVFINRLQKDMKLQSDPTAAYAVTEGKKPLKRRITKKDLRIESPINTYHVEGLPPQPIACPGKKALEAVVRPQKTKNLFFVANGYGGHNFSRTNAEHERHVSTWRRFSARKKAITGTTHWSQCKK